MSLFEFSELRGAIKKGDEPSLPVAIRGRGTARVVLADRSKKVGEAIGAINLEEFIWVPSFGNWSAHHVVECLVAQIGPCEMWFTSWAISEGPIRKLLAVDQINIRGAVLSDRVKTECPKAFQLLSANLGSIALRKNHSKGFVLTGAELSVSVTMTANFTANRRIEMYAISTHQSVVNAHLNLIQTVINGIDGQDD
jgi:hypothetical protein